MAIDHQFLTISGRSHPSHSYILELEDMVIASLQRGRQG